MGAQPEIMRDGAEIAVIGAGVVGLCTALRLAQEGYEVALIAPAGDGTGTSFGNAGVVADYAVLPIGNPGVLRDLPRLLFSRDSPLALRWGAAPALAPWLTRFLRQAMPGAARRNAQALAGLLAGAGAEWARLAGEIGAQDLLRRRGVLYAFETAREFRAAKGDIDWRRSLGVPIEILRPEEIGQLEPGLPGHAAGGGAAFFPETLSLIDPGEVMHRLAAAVAAAGVRRIEGRVARLQRLPPGRGVALEGAGLALRARRVVIAAGAWSRALARDAGDRVPLETERGYHLEFDMAAPPLSRPFTPVPRGLYFCPMAGRLRVAGTIELGGLDAPESPARLAYLLRGARAILPDLPEPDRQWLGFRPSLPDSLPVIGPSRAGDDVLAAFGHGHLGLTLAPVTARIIAALIRGDAPDRDPAPFLPGRFRALPI